MAKAKSVKEYTETRSPNQNVTTIWQRVKTLTGNYTLFHLKTITSINITITDPLKTPLNFQNIILPNNLPQIFIITSFLNITLYKT